MTPAYRHTYHCLSNAMHSSTEQNIKYVTLFLKSVAVSGVRCSAVYMLTISGIRPVSDY